MRIAITGKLKSFFSRLRELILSRYLTPDVRDRIEIAFINGPFLWGWCWAILRYPPDSERYLAGIQNAAILTVYLVGLIVSEFIFNLIAGWPAAAGIIRSAMALVYLIVCSLLVYRAWKHTPFIDSRVVRIRDFLFRNS